MIGFDGGVGGVVLRADWVSQGWRQRDKELWKETKPRMVEMAKEKFKNGQFNIYLDVISISVM